jgi:hypothetical protein
MVYYRIKGEGERLMAYIEEALLKFKPFVLKEGKKIEISNKTKEKYQSILEKLKTSKRAIVRISTNDEGSEQKEEFNLNDGVIKLIESSMYLRNLQIYYNNVHASDSALNEISQFQTDSFFQELFKIDPDINGFELDEVYIENNIFFISFVADDQYMIEIKLI